MTRRVACSIALAALALATANSPCWCILAGGVADGEPPAAALEDIRSAYPEDQFYREAFTIVQVRVTVRDARGAPIRNAQVIAYSEDWGVRLPVDGPFAMTDDRGDARLLVMKGRWSFFAGGGQAQASERPGEGYFLAELDRTVTADAAIALEPSDRISISVPLDAQEVRAMEAAHTPLVAMPVVGATRGGRMTLFTTRGLRQRLVLVRSPIDGLGYLISPPPVAAGQAINLRLAADELCLVRFRIADHTGRPGTATVAVGASSLDLDQGWQLTHFSIDGQADFYFTPVTGCMYYLYSSGGCSYWFNRKPLRLEAGSVREENFGGPLTASIVAANDTMSQSATNLGFMACDRYGNVLDFYCLANGKKPVISIQFYDEERRLAFADNWVHDSDWLHMRVESTFAIGDRLNYDIQWDLGVYGSARLQGKLISDKTRYGWEEVHSEHFDGYFPLGFAQRGSRVLQRLESAYRLMADVVGHELTRRLHVAVPINPGATGQASGDWIYVWPDSFVWWEPGERANNFESTLYHELGHHMEAFTFDQGAPVTGSRNEAMASYLSFTALGHLEGSEVTQFRMADECQYFLRFLCGSLPRTSPNWEGLVNRFVIHLYLPRQYGTDIHRRFFHNWVDCRRTLKDFTEEQAFVTTYSFLAGKNLAGLFHFIGYDVTPQVVYKGLERLAARGAQVGGVAR